MEPTTENNKLIAEFMGIKPILQSPDVYSWNDSPFFYCTESTPEKVMEGVANYAKYHTSWDWLMPVVEKIEKIESDVLPAFSINSFAVVIKCSQCQIISGDFMDTKMPFNIHYGGKLEATYKAVVEFIKWYNT